MSQTASPPQVNCADCATPLSGKYCHECGQKAHLHHSLWHIAEELLHGLLHLEAKSWRSLSLLVRKPGQLSRAYLEGQRTRYVSPLALFLLMGFLFFFVLGFTYSELVPVKNQTYWQNQLSALQLAEQEMAREKTSRTAESMTKLKALQAQQHSIRQALQSWPAGMVHKELNLGIEESPGLLATLQAVRRDLQTSLSKGEQISGSAWLDRKLVHVLSNPELSVYKIRSGLGKLIFLLFPLSLALVTLLFFRVKSYTVFDHAVFTLNSLAFACLLMSALVLLTLADFTVLAVVLACLILPWHMYRHLRLCYQLSWWSGLWRTVVLLVMAWLCLLLYGLILLFFFV